MREVVVDVIRSVKDEVLLAQKFQKILAFIQPALILDRDSIETITPTRFYLIVEKFQVFNISILLGAGELTCFWVLGRELVALLTEVALGLHHSLKRAVFDERKVGVVSARNAENLHA